MDAVRFAGTGNTEVRDAGEAGGAAAVEMAVLWGAMLLMVAAAVQVALLFYAGQVALTAAEDGLRSGRYFENPSPDRAQADAEAFLERVAGSVLQSTAVLAELDPAAGLLRVRVTARVISLVPGVELDVTKEAAGPVERVVP